MMPPKRPERPQLDLDFIMDGAVDEAIVFDQLEDAIVGVDHNGYLVYSHEQMLRCFMEQGMTQEEAFEWIDFNILGFNGGDGFTIIMQERGTKYDA